MKTDGFKMLKISKENLQRRLDRYARDGLPKRCREIGGGYSRIAYLDPREKIVYKIGRRKCNLTEWIYWRSIPGSHRKFFAEVYGISDCGEVIAMQYVPFNASNSEELDWDELEDKTSQLIDRIGLPELTDDIHCGNIGFDEHHHIKLFDYGEEMYRVPLNLIQYREYFKQKNREFKQRGVQKALTKGVFK